MIEAQREVVISTHAPRAGSDSQSGKSEGVRLYFNPRSPCGERHNLRHLSIGMYDFNPRSPCGERQEISRHTPRRNQFQPTLPVRGATLGITQAYEKILISTHAPRAGSDLY